MNPSTRKELEMLIENLSKSVGIDLRLDTHSPGDGWTRCRVAVSDNDTTIHTTIHGYLSNSFKPRELVCALSLTIQILYLKEKTDGS